MSNGLNLAYLFIYVYITRKSTVNISVNQSIKENGIKGRIKKKKNPAKKNKRKSERNNNITMRNSLHSIFLYALFFLRQRRQTRENKTAE